MLSASPRRMLLAVGLSLALSAASLLLSGHFFQLGVCDDSLIAARYASNWSSHSELAFNPGERVEGYTSFLTVALAAALQMFGIPADRGVYLLGLLSGIAGCGLVSFILYRDEENFPPAVMSGLGLSLLLPWAVWAHSGLETCLFADLWLLTLWLYSGSSSRSACLSGFSMALCAMTRPEGLLLIIPIAWQHFRRERNWVRVAQMLAVFIAIFIPYFLCRWSYFGYLLPNTYYAKVDRFSFPLVERGATYLGGFVLKMIPLFLLFAFSAGSTAGQSIRLIRFSVLTYAALGVVLVGGDHFPVYRFCVQMLPALVILLWIPSIRRFRFLILALPACSILASALFLTDLGNYSAHRRDVMKWTYIGGFLKKTAAPDASIATLAIGAIGYYSQLKVIDMYGIVDTHIAHLEIETGKGLAGHEKFDNSYVLSRRPDIILLDNQLHPVPGTLLLWGAAAPDMERRAEFKANYRFVPVQTALGWIHLFLRKDLIHPPS